MFVFAMSNGYIASLIFLAAVVEPSLEEDEIDVRLRLPSLPPHEAALLTAGAPPNRSRRRASCSTSPPASSQGPSSRSLFGQLFVDAPPSESASPGQA